MKFYHSGDSTPRAIDFLTKLPVQGMENLPLVSVVKKTWQTIKTIVVAFAYLPELEGKTLLLKISHTSDTGMTGMSWMDLT